MLNNDDKFYYSPLIKEMTYIGARLGSSYKYSEELKLMNYEEVMNS